MRQQQASRQRRGRALDLRFKTKLKLHPARLHHSAPKAQSSSIPHYNRPRHVQPTPKTGEFFNWHRLCKFHGARRFIYWHGWPYGKFPPSSSRFPLIREFPSISYLRKQRYSRWCKGPCANISPSHQPLQRCPSQQLTSSIKQKCCFRWGKKQWCHERYVAVRPKPRHHACLDPLVLQSRPCEHGSTWMVPPSSCRSWQFWLRRQQHAGANIGRIPAHAAVVWESWAPYPDGTPYAFESACSFTFNYVPCLKRLKWQSLGAPSTWHVKISKFQRREDSIHVLQSVRSNEFKPSFKLRQWFAVSRQHHFKK